MPTNDILPFCPTDTGTNLPTQPDYSGSSIRTGGAIPGVASSQYNNKPLRQATYIASQVAQFLANTTGASVLDDATPAKLLAQIVAALQFYPPNLTKYTSGSGNWNKTYIFMIASGSATIAATYTNNGVTYTVVATVASGTVIKMTGNGAPAVSGTLTKASGTGDSSLTFYAVRAPIAIQVELVGGGGGGGGSGTAGSVTGGVGGDTTFGTTLLSGGGGGAGGTSTGGVGGASSLGTGPIGLAITGGRGSANSRVPSGGGGTNNLDAGASGAPGPWGGGAAGGAGGGGAAGVGTAGATNSGAGGGGGGGDNVTNLLTGAGGGAGGYVCAMITSPASTYAYVVGAAGTAGSAGTSGFVAGAGGSGVIIVTEYYQ